MFWISTVFLVALASLFVLLPLLFGTRRKHEEDPGLRRQANISMYQDRLADLQSELDSGILAQEQFEELKVELQKSLLSDVDSSVAGSPQVEKVTTKGKSGKHKQQNETAGRNPLHWAVPVVLVVIACSSAYVFYARWGSFDEVVHRDLYQRTLENPGDAQEAQDLIVSLGELVQEDEERRWAWYFLAENFANLGLFNEAGIAYQQAADQFEDGGEKALILGRIAMIRYILADFQIDGEVQSVIDQVRDINPRESSILQLLASDAEQRGDWQTAIENWRLLIQLSPNSEQARQLRLNIAAAQQILAESGEAGQGPVIDVALSLAEGLELDPALRVFVAVRNAAREGMPPLAAASLTVAELPATVSLSNALSVGGFNLSSADTVYVSALVSMRGVATPGSGDYRAVTDNFAHNGQHTEIDLVIESSIP